MLLNRPSLQCNERIGPSGSTRALAESLEWFEVDHRASSLEWLRTYTCDRNRAIDVSLG